MLFTILKTEGYDVALAEDGDQGLQSYRSRPADVVLLDMVMPRKDGLATIRELHIEFPDVTILAMSGDTSNGFRDVLAEARKPARISPCKPSRPNGTTLSRAWSWGVARKPPTVCTEPPERDP